jgi:hypothetical protein
VWNWLQRWLHKVTASPSACLEHLMSELGAVSDGLLLMRPRRDTTSSSVSTTSSEEMWVTEAYWSPAGPTRPGTRTSANSSSCHKLTLN